MRWYRIDGKWVLGKGSKRKPKLERPRLLLQDRHAVAHLKAIVKGG